MDEVYKEVDFNKYCATCKDKDTEEKYDPCNECLTETVNVNSEKPVYWKEKTR